METAGVVGTGAMGSVIVERLVKAGRKVLAYDVSPAALERAATAGAEPCASPAAVGRGADVVGVMVLSDEQMLDCVLGPNGVLEGLSAGKVLLLHSTIHPRTTRQIARAAQERGVAVADACITSQPEPFRAGHAACIVGGDPAVVERIRPHLQLLGKSIFYMGPLGAGDVAKILRNLVGVSNQLILREALLLAEAEGIPYSRLLELLRWVPPLLDQPDAALNPHTTGPIPMGARNLFEQILPPADQLAAEGEVNVPIIRLLASDGNPYRR